MKKKSIVNVNNAMQKGYRYEISARPGKDFDPLFKPDLTPEQMLELGVFGGVYMRDCPSEYPAVW